MKSMTIIKFFLLILGALSLTKGFCMPRHFLQVGETRFKQTHEGTDGVVKPETQFTKAYIEDYEYTQKTFKGKSLDAQSMGLSAGGRPSDKLKSLEVRRFKSREALNTSKGLFLRFSLSSYRYATAAQAKQVFKSYRMAILAEPEEMRSKSPMLVMLSEHVIYILNGSCQFSKANMTLIEDELEKAVLQGRILQNECSIKRYCGGALSKESSL